MNWIQWMYWMGAALLYVLLFHIRDMFVRVPDLNSDPNPMSDNYNGGFTYQFQPLTWLLSSCTTKETKKE